MHNLLVIEPETGELNKTLNRAMRHARKAHIITGYSASMIVAALGITEIALDRDRSFHQDDAEKYNEWFKNTFHEIGITISADDHGYTIHQDATKKFTAEVFKLLLPLKKDLLHSIPFTTESKYTTHIYTRRLDFSVDEKGEHMDRIVEAMVNQEGLRYDPNSDTFIPYH